MSSSFELERWREEALLRLKIDLGEKMADFDYEVLYIYDGGGAFSLLAQDTDNGTASDGDADTTFETGDTYTAVLEDSTNGDAPFNATVTYQGFVSFQGEDLPVGVVPLTDFPPLLVAAAGAVGPNVYVVADFRPEGSFTPPATLDLASTLTAQPYPVCFLSGTAIATPEGEAAVETLAIGDEILTGDGRVVPVKWIGRQTVSTRFGPAERLMPVRILAGALGDGLPRRDLTLTADHALLIDGVLVNAGALVNGSTVVQVPLAEFGKTYTVYHVETDAHDIILAEGAPTETYIDYVSRRVFDNYDTYLALYGEDRAIRQMDYPRVSAARMVPAVVKARLSKGKAA